MISGLVSKLGGAVSDFSLKVNIGSARRWCGKAVDYLTNSKDSLIVLASSVTAAILFQEPLSFYPVVIASSLAGGAVLKNVSQKNLSLIYPFLITIFLPHGEDVVSKIILVAGNYFLIGESAQRMLELTQRLVSSFRDEIKVDGDHEKISLTEDIKNNKEALIIAICITAFNVFLKMPKESYPLGAFSAFAGAKLLQYLPIENDCSFFVFPLHFIVTKLLPTNPATLLEFNRCLVAHSFLTSLSLQAIVQYVENFLKIPKPSEALEIKKF